MAILSPTGLAYEVAGYLYRSHNRFHFLRVQLQHAIEDGDFIVPEGLFSCPMELQERPKFCLFVCVVPFAAEDAVQEFRGRPCNRCLRDRETLT
jgi:hypothetical protein